MKPSTGPLLSTLVFLALLGCAAIEPEPSRSTPQSSGASLAVPRDASAARGGASNTYEATEGYQTGLAARTPQKRQSLPEVRIERVSSVVPWPRGIAWVDGKLAVLARGRHRSYGGPAPEVFDLEATIFEIDPEIREPYVPGELPSTRIAANGRVLAEPDPDVIHLYDRSKPPIDNWLMNRPFCTMAYDEASRNLIFCAYSGVDMSGKDGGPTFRKNATDALFRFDLRTGTWGVIEMHRPDVVPREEQGEVISNVYYPHHDIRRNPPPHGFLNGPNGCGIAGRWLYAVGKDNHSLARYDLTPIRRNPNAGPPPAELVLGENIDVRIDGKVKTIPVHGHSAVAVHGPWFYLASRTSSLILRFPITPDGDLVRPIVGEVVAEFEPYTTETKRSANLWEMITAENGDVVVSVSSQGRVWRFSPDPTVPFDGNDKRKDGATPNQPWIDIKALTGNPRANISNLVFAPDGSLYFCMAMPEEGRPLAGNVMRASVVTAPGP